MYMLLHSVERKRAPVARPSQAFPEYPLFSRYLSCCREGPLPALRSPRPTRRSPLRPGTQEPIQPLPAAAWDAASHPPLSAAPRDAGSHPPLSAAPRDAGSHPSPLSAAPRGRGPHVKHPAHPSAQLSPPRRIKPSSSSAADNGLCGVSLPNCWTEGRDRLSCTAPKVPRSPSLSNQREPHTAQSVCPSAFQDSSACNHPAPPWVQVQEGG